MISVELPIFFIKQWRKVVRKKQRQKSGYLIFWPPALLYSPWCLASSAYVSVTFLAFLEIQSGLPDIPFCYLDSASIITFHEYYKPLTKWKIKVHQLVTFTRALTTNKYNLTYLFHAKAWSLMTSVINWDCRFGFI